MLHQNQSGSIFGWVYLRVGRYSGFFSIQFRVSCKRSIISNNCVFIQQQREILFNNLFLFNNNKFIQQLTFFESFISSYNYKVSAIFQFLFSSNISNHSNTVLFGISFALHSKKYNCIQMSYFYSGIFQFVYAGMKVE